MKPFPQYFIPFILVFFFNGFSQDLASHNIQRFNVDVNQDGFVDCVEGFHMDSTFVLRLILIIPDKGNDTSEINFNLNNNDYQNAFCGEEIEMELESLDYDPSEIFDEEFVGFIPTKELCGIILSDGSCDSFHFFWNHSLNQLQYWRL